MGRFVTLVVGRLEGGGVGFGVGRSVGFGVSGGVGRSVGFGVSGRVGLGVGRRVGPGVVDKLQCCQPSLKMHCPGLQHCDEVVQDVHKA